MRLIVTLAALLLALPAPAHEVRHTVAAAADAVTVRLVYADGQPFAFEAYEATPEGADKPAHVGRTDAQGNALFLAGTVRHWRLKAWSADGHGADLRIEAPAGSAGAAPAAASSAPVTAPADHGPNRASLALFGLSLIVGGFGLFQLTRRKP